MNMPRVVIAGTHSGCGKTTTAMGIAAALTARGVTVQAYKTGPDYIDPAFYGELTGRPGRNLDGWMLSENTLRYLFERNAAGADVALIEGVMGLYDGIGSQGSASTAEAAMLLESPVILVIDVQGMATSAAALVLGYQQYNPSLKLAGVIVNRFSHARHLNTIRSAVEQSTGISVLGGLPRSSDFSLGSRHLGLVPAAELANLPSRIQTLRAAVEEHLDLELLLRLAATAPVFQQPADPAAGLAPVHAVRIGVAKDRAFHFYYQDSLDLLERLGAQLVPFSPLADPGLPADVNGLLIGGGFPEVFARELSENHRMKAAIAQALDNGMPCLAECGGLMLLAGQLCDASGETYPMTGFLPASVRMTDQLQRFGYVTVTQTRDTVIGPRGTVFRAHEFHYSAADVSGIPTAYSVSRASDGRTWECGFIKENTLAAYPHLNFWSNPSLAVHFLNACQAWR